MRFLRLFLALAAVGGAGEGVAQSSLDRSPNLHGTWTLPPGNPVFVFAHRFRFYNGGDELVNFPTLTLAAGIPLGLTAGLDYTSYSEAIPERVTGNETQYWIKRAFGVPTGPRVAALGGYNSAAKSWDGALSGALGFGPLTGFAELRAFSSLFGTGDAGAAGALGAAVRLTEHLSLSSDIARVLSADTFAAAWSTGVGIAIPGTPHTLSLQASNVGATTLQGTSREAPAFGSPSVRYGFLFTVPLGSGSQWMRIFRPVPVAPLRPSTGEAALQVVMQMIAYTPGEVRIRVGDSVEWINRDPVEHTVTAEDQSWGSEMIKEGERYVRRFDTAGTFPYFCLPHPMMKGVVIVEP